MKKVNKYLCIFLVLAVVIGIFPVNVVASANGNAFVDVSENDWYYSAVQYVYERGLMSGTSKTTFSPTDTTTRGMIVTILHRLEGKPEATGETFSDVPINQYYTDAVAWASANGIVSGYGNGRFGPDDNITREQMATILYRYVLFKGYDSYVKGDCSSFVDGSKVSSYAREAMNWAIGIGLISGVGSNVLSPAGSATRAQAAMILMRFCSLFDNSGTENYEPTTDALVYISPGLYTDISGDEHVKISQETGLMYYDNELIVYGSSGTSMDNVERLIAEDNGFIVGRDIYTNSYLVRFNNSLPYDMLSQLAERYAKAIGIDSVFLNLAITMDTSVAPSYASDIWPWEAWSTENNEYGNWGLLAIKAREAWSMSDKMDTVQVGVFDGGCDPTHKDLENVIVKSVLLSTNKREIDHGTHVAGIIGANFNDDYGVCGICPTSEVFVIDHHAAFKSTLTSGYFYITAYSYLIGECNCKVVNMSLEYNLIGLAASHGNKNAKYQMEKCSDLIEQALLKLKNNGNEFTICVAAGNMNDDGYFKSGMSEYGHFLECTYAEEHGHQAGTLYYLDDYGNCRVCTPEMIDARGVGSSLDAASWASPICAITNEELTSRIIVVGSCNNDNGGYALSSFSCLGDRVDVIAPGENIFSCVSNGQHDFKCGTSMASPHVAGIAALIYALCPDISGDRVKEIIVETANTDVDGTTKNMVNAYEAALIAAVEGEINSGFITGKVLNTEEVPISNVTVTLVDNTTGARTTTSTDKNGSYDFELSAGNYNLIFEKEGYKTVTGILDLRSFTSSSGWSIQLENVVMQTIVDGQTIAGIVIDIETGVPLHRMEVRFWSEMYPEETETVITEEDGSFTFTGKTITGDWWSLSVTDTLEYTFDYSDNPTAEGYDTIEGFCGYLYVKYSFTEYEP